MKDRIANLERIAAEKKKREAQAIADYKAGQEETKSAPKKVSANFVGKAYDYVPPAPKSTPSIPAPPKGGVKTFAIKTGECPWMMDLPGIKAGVQPVMTEEEKVAEAAVDDGLTPEEKKKEKLSGDPGFKKYITMKKMGVLLINIRRKIKQDGMGYDWKDMNCFANYLEIE